ncbi:MAG: DivIVA domain-containing protein, partial [Acidimicrobiia bacterium]|nr:DivIVA domain-containing protein [Acidimicrobiia bacterium]
LDIQRPDPSSPAAIASAQFTMSRRGYSEDEVRDFLRQVSVEVSRLIERERFLQSELKALQSRGPMDMSAVDEATVTELLGAEAARVLSAAREAAQAMRDRAAESAENIVREASREAARVLEEATTEASRRRTDVTTEAEQEIELAKEQGREMVAEVRAYRERVLADLARRTDEARRELERLVQERDRLISAFERARSAASGVVGEEGVDLARSFVVSVATRRELEARSRWNNSSTRSCASRDSPCGSVLGVADVVGAGGVASTRSNAGCKGVTDGAVGDTSFLRRRSKRLTTSAIGSSGVAAGLLVAADSLVAAGSVGAVGSGSAETVEFGSAVTSSSVGDSTGSLSLVMPSAVVDVAPSFSESLASVVVDASGSTAMPRSGVLSAF